MELSGNAIISGTAANASTGYSSVRQRTWTVVESSSTIDKATSMFYRSICVLSVFLGSVKWTLIGNGRCWRCTRNAVRVSPKSYISLCPSLERFEEVDRTKVLSKWKKTCFSGQFNDSKGVFLIISIVGSKLNYQSHDLATCISMMTFTVANEAWRLLLHSLAERPRVGDTATAAAACTADYLSTSLSLYSLSLSLSLSLEDFIMMEKRLERERESALKETDITAACTITQNTNEVAGLRPIQETAVAEYFISYFNRVY